MGAERPGRASLLFIKMVQLTMVIAYQTLRAPTRVV